MGQHDSVADVSLWQLKMNVYQENAKLFEKAGFTRSLAERILKRAWLTVWDAYYLFCQAKKIPRDGTYLEIKSWPGATAELVHESIKHSHKRVNFTTITPNPNEPFLKITNSISHFKLIKSHASPAKTQIPDKSVDLLFLDGARSYEYVKRDIQDYWPKVKLGGAFLVHDYSSEKAHGGVVRAVNEAFGWNMQKLDNSRTVLIEKQHEDLWTDRIDGGIGTVGTRKCDVIIPYYHGQRQTCECIQSVIDSSKDYRIIATSDGSKISEIQNIGQALKSAERFTHLINLKNIGFPGNINRALRIIEAEYVAVINNDVTVRSTWLEKLEEEFLRREKNCFIGPSGAAVSRIGGNTSSDRFPEVDYLGWALIFSDRKCFNRVGLLDERFAIGYYEDVDFGLRAKKLGIKSYVFSPPIKHEGGFSMNKIEPLRLGHARNLNLKYLKTKWGFK